MGNSLYNVESAQALLQIPGSGSVFVDKDVAFATNDPKFHSNLVAEVVYPNSAGIFVEIFRMDLYDAPETINVERYQVTLVGSRAYKTKLQFHGPGHRRTDLPSSLGCLPFIFS